MISAILDACVLYSGALRGFLLHIAGGGLFEPYWSEEIQNEWTRNLFQNCSDLKQKKLENTCQTMDFHFPNGLVRGYESITHTLVLPDPGDRHVLAVAIHAKAEYIITFNLRDFPKAALQPYGIQATSPDEFALRLIHDEPYHVLVAVRKHRLSLKNPPKTVEEYLETLAKQGLPKTVVFLREHESDI